MLTVDLSGKKALVMGVANERSLGYAIAQKLRAAGAELALSYQAERLRPDLERVAQALGGALLFQADVTKDEELDALFRRLREAWGHLDYLVHSLAFAPREAFSGRYLDTTRADWLLTLEVSAFSLVAAVQRAEPLLRPGGAILTLTAVGGGVGLLLAYILGLAVPFLLVALFAERLKGWLKRAGRLSHYVELL
ncbi:MAG: SDR family oxidoreductase, partial [Candidatus Bipolaricaulaceae bacterium]